MNQISVLLSSGLGIGFLPKAPGTFGTLWGVLLFYLAHHWETWQFVVGILVLTLLSLPFVHFAGKKLGETDSGTIVLDEVLGYLVSVVGFPFGLWPVLWAFFWFRLFDIFKPFPIRDLERKVPGAYGVIFDDLLAGVYANIALRLTFWIGAVLGLSA